MSNTKASQDSTSPTPENVENNHKEAFSSVTEMIEGTPFQIVRREPGWFLAIKHTRLTEYYETREEAEQYLEDKKWFIILQLIVHVVKCMSDEALDELENKMLVNMVKNNADIN